MMTESLHAGLAETLTTQGPAAAELTRGRCLPADGELTDGDLEAIAAGKTIVGGGPGWGWGGGGGFFRGGLFFRRGFWW